MTGPTTHHGGPAGGPAGNPAGTAAGWPHPPEWPLPPGRRPPGRPGTPWAPEQPGRPAPAMPLLQPARAWPDGGDWPDRVYERLLERRIVMAHGFLGDQAATLLCAQLLTLDASGDDPIRLQLQGLDGELPAALTVMDALDAVGVPVHAYAGGHISGPALGVLAAAGRRFAYPSAGFRLAEPRTAFDGTAAELSSRGRQLTTMLDALYVRLAEVTGREVDEIRDDARAGRFLTAEQAVSYGLVNGVAHSGAGGPDAGR